VSVSSAEFIRNVGHWQNQALRQPISITHHGRERLVIATPHAFESGAVKADTEARELDADAVLQNLEDGFLAFDTSLRLERINLAAAAYIGRSRETVLGAAAEELPSPMNAALHERLQRVMRTRKPESFEAAVDGRHLSMRVFPLAKGAAVLFADTTEEHDQRERLGVGAALWAATGLHPQAAAVTLDVRGRVTAIHETLCAWLGFQRGDLIGQLLFDMAPPEQSRGVAEAIDAALGGATPRQIPVTLLGKDGRQVQGTLALVAIRTDVKSNGVVALMAPDGRPSVTEACQTQIGSQ
jgi:PAS domain S-box-containing protein